MEAMFLPFWSKIEIKDSKERTIIQRKLNLMKLLLFFVGK